MKDRVMYIESKADGSNGEARIGRVSFSKTGNTLRYLGKEFIGLKGRGFKSNYLEVSTGDEYWISGPRKDGQDRLYASAKPICVDDDVREEYWGVIRELPEFKDRSCT